MYSCPGEETEIHMHLLVLSTAWYKIYSPKGLLGTHVQFLINAII